MCNDYSDDAGNCLPSESLDELCHDITGDQPLLSMFRADNASTIPCPFKSPPYKFSYNRGSGECSQNSRIDSCTDDSKLLIYFAACPDVPGTESGGIQTIYFCRIENCMLINLFLCSFVSERGNGKLLQCLVATEGFRCCQRFEP